MKPNTPLTSKVQSLVYEKLLICLNKGYMTFTPERKVKSYITYFPVRIGIQDVRIMYDETSCRMNKSLNDSNF